MSRPDLRALFRINSRSIVATDIFANREEEWAAVVRSLACIAVFRKDPSFDVEDVQAPRRNVLTFYGVGGIGKTTLSQQIADRLAYSDAGPSHWPPLDASAGRVLPVRVDLSRQFGASLETVLLSIRLAVATLGRPMPAFDLAFLRYWEMAHPGEPLDDYLRQHTYFSRFSASGRTLRGQMESALADIAQALVLPGTIGSLAGQGLRTVIRSLRDRKSKARVLAGCRRLPDLLEADPDGEALSYYPHLLAWDLEQLPADRAATIVVLLDTFEDVGDRTHRDRERLIQRVAWLMPNSLFVVTGRNRLSWDDARLEGQLDWAGAHAWPQLVAGAAEDPRQYRVGYLSEDDAHGYLQRRLTLNAQPLMDEAIRQVIVTRSHGLPLYLDLTVMRFLDLYERVGQTPDVTEFDHDLPALVARTFRDLTVEERQVLRATSLLDAFSVDLATTAAGMDHDAPALALVERPFVDVEPGALWPYHLHDLVRSAVRDADSTAEDRWTAADWRRSAQRTFDALGVEYRAGTERRRLLGCLRQGLRLARDFDLDLGWLTDAAFAYVGDFLWEPLDLDVSDAHVDSPAVVLADTLNAIARRQRQHRSLTAERLRVIVDSGHLPTNLRELPSYFLAEIDRDLGNLTASLNGMRAVAEGGGRLAPDANRGLLHLAKRVGQFPDVLTAVESLGRAGKQDRAMGELWWTQGNIGLSCSAFAQGRDEALALDQEGEAALSQAYLAFAASFQDRARALVQIERAGQMLAGMSARFAELQVRNAGLLAECGVAVDLPEQADQVAASAVADGLTSCVAYARFAACFHAAIVDSADLMGAARAQLQLSVRREEFAYLLELAYLMAGEQVPDDLPRARWIDGVEQTQARWTALVAERRLEILGHTGG